jgi:heme exporter protein B
MDYFRRAGWIAMKDLRLEWRNLEKLSSMGFFSILLLVVLHVSFDFSRLGFQELGAGVLWVAISFAGLVGLGHSFVLERQHGCLQALMLCPGDRSAIYLGKFLSNLLFVVAVEAVVLVLAAVLFNYYLPPVLPSLAAVMLLYTLGFVALGTLFAAMSTGTRRGEMLLAILLFPLLLPAIMTSVRTAGRLLAGVPLAELGTYLIFNASYDVIIMVASLLFFPFVIEE